MSDIRFFQKRLAALADGDCLEVSERISHEIDRSTFHRQCFCAAVGEGAIAYNVQKLADFLKQYPEEPKVCSISALAHRAFLKNGGLSLNVR